jgi:pimeloyl-ACP methyl ester carboxylesterase
MVAALDQCREMLSRRPWGDLRQYTTTIAMADVDAVRAALGAERIDVIGVSYGTRAGLEYLRAYPTHVRRLVLDAVAPPDMVLPASMGVDAAAALDALFRDCAATPACHDAHPALAAHWQSMLASLPHPITAADPVSGESRSFSLSRESAWGLVRPGLYVPALGAALPYAIDEAWAGRFAPLLALGSALGGNGGFDLFEGMHFSVICAEDAPRLPTVPTAASAANAGDDFSALYREVCARWPRGEVPAAFYTIAPSPVPVLLLSGAADPVTPPRHAQRVAQALGPKARAIVVPNAGHGALSLPCVRDAAVRFIDVVDDGDALKTDLACVEHLPRPLSFTPPAPHRASSAPNEVPAHVYGKTAP